MRAERQEKNRAHRSSLTSFDDFMIGFGSWRLFSQSTCYCHDSTSTRITREAKAFRTAVSDAIIESGSREILNLCVVRYSENMSSVFIQRIEHGEDGGGGGRCRCKRFSVCKHA